MKRDAFIPTVSGLALGLSAATRRPLIFKHTPKAMLVRSDGRRQVLGLASGAVLS